MGTPVEPIEQILLILAGRRSWVQTDQIRRSEGLAVQLGSLIERSLAQHGYSLMLCNSAEDLEKESDYLRMVAAKGIVPGVNPKAVMPVLNRIHELTQLEEHDGDKWCGVEAVKEKRPSIFARPPVLKDEPEKA